MVSLKFSSILLVVIGETLAIYAELAAAHATKTSGQLSYGTVVPNLLLVSLGGILLVFGYVLGVRGFGDAWLIAVISILSILVIEPPLVFVFFSTWPGRGELLGLGCGIVGILATLLIKD